MIGRYTTGALVTYTQPRGARAALSRLTARDDFDEFEFLAVHDAVRDGDGCLAPDDDHRVEADVAGAKDVLDRRLRALKLDADGRTVEPAAYGDFGRNPSSSARGQTLKTKALL